MKSIKINLIYFFIITIGLSGAGCSIGCKKDSSTSVNSSSSGGDGASSPTHSGSVFCSTCTSTHTISVSPGGYAISLQMDPMEYTTWKNNYNSGIGGYHDDKKRKSLVMDIYAKFNNQDLFDFIFLIMNETNVPNGWPYGELIKVSNDISGIGLRKNIPSGYGSVARLKAVMSLAKISGLTYGPSLHELMHNWGNFIIKTEDINAEGTTVNGRPHWGFMGADVNPRLGGFKESSIEGSSSPGVYQVGLGGAGNDGGYSQLELYLMGMIPLTSVQPFSVFSNVSNPMHIPSNQPYTATQINGTRTIYQQSDVITAAATAGGGDGTRIPSSATSQKAFRLLVVVLTPTSLSSAQWKIFDTAAENFGRHPQHNDKYPLVYNFFEATRGLGTMQTGNLK